MKLTKKQYDQIKPYKELYEKFVKSEKIVVFEFDNDLAFKINISSKMTLTTGFSGLIQYLRVKTMER